MKTKKLILILFMFIVLLNISYSNNILFFKDTFSKNQSLTITYIMDINNKESILNSTNLFYSDNTYYTGKSSAGVNNPFISTTGGYQVFNTPLDSIGFIVYDFGENVTILNNSYFIFNSSGFNDDPTARPAALHIVFDKDDSSLTEVETYYISLNNNYFVNMSSLNGQKFRFMRLHMGSTNSFSNFHNLNNLELYNFRTPFNSNNTLPYFDSIDINPYVEFCNNETQINYTFNAIDDENDTIYYATETRDIYKSASFINEPFGTSINDKCVFNSNFLQYYSSNDSNIDFIGNYKLNDGVCDGRILTHYDREFSIDSLRSFYTDTTIIQDVYLNNANQDNFNFSICPYNENYLSIDCINFEFINKDELLVYNLDKTFYRNISNYDLNSKITLNQIFKFNDSKIITSIMYNNESVINTYVYNISKNINSFRGYYYQSSELDYIPLFNPVYVALGKFNLLSTEISEDLDWSADKPNSITIFNQGEETLNIYFTDSQGIYSNNYTLYSQSLQLLPCDTIYNTDFIDINDENISPANNFISQFIFFLRFPSRLLDELGLLNIFKLASIIGVLYGLFQINSLDNFDILNFLIELGIINFMLLIMNIIYFPFGLTAVILGLYAIAVKFKNNHEGVNSG